MSDPTSPAGPPAEITHLVRERTEARARRDWRRADALKAQIEAAGWRVTDHGSRTSVGPAAPPSMEIGGEVRYGSASTVPSLLDEPATAAWTVAVIASEEPERLSRFLGALRSNVPAGIQVVVVANDPSAAQAAALEGDTPDRTPTGGRPIEVLRTSSRLGYAAALNVGLRRSTGEFVLLADATARPTGDALGPLAAALEDPEAAAAGGFGLVAAEPGPLRPNALVRLAADDAATAAGATDATALEGAWLAFRRSDYLALGPLDERFVTPAWLDVWWTLRLRAGQEPEGEEYVEPEGAEYVEPGDAADAAAPAGGDPAATGAAATGAAATEAAATEAAATEAAQPGAATPGVSLPAPRRAVRLELPLEREAAPWPPDRSRLNRRNMYRVLDRFGPRDDLA